LDIRRQYGLLVRAIRRDGKFIRLPGEDIELLPGDRILLCGPFSALNQIQQILAPETPSPLPLVPVVRAGESEALREFLPVDNLRDG
jgi:CPA2 family monovalent cation:H+ antiporter-2